MTTGLLTATITMESRAGIVNRSTPSRKDMKARKSSLCFQTFKLLALCWTSFAKARVEIQLPLSFFYFLEQNHAADKYTWR